MSTEDTGHDELLHAYRRGSQARAGAPSDETRRAILAGARAEALKRRPAANDSRYAWSAAAGIAVLGIALLLWRQADPRLSTRAATPAPTQAPVAEVAQADTSDAQELRVAAEEAARRTYSVEREASRTAPAAARVPPPTDPAGQVLRDRFPEAWASRSPPATVWIIEDAQGNPVRQGTLAAGERLPSLRPAVSAPAARAAAGASAEAQSGVTADSAQVTMPQPGWSLRTTLNGAGVPVSVATAREQR